MSISCRSVACAAFILFFNLGIHAAETKIKICLAGDSTVQTYKPGESLVGWGQVLNQFFNDDVVFENHAIGGRSTKTFISEGRWKKLLESKPGYVMIQFGHNDAHGKDKPESTDANTDYMNNLRTYVDEAKAAGVVPILISPMHRRIFEKSGEPSAELLPYATAMKKVALEKGVIFVDLYSASGILLKDLGSEGSLDLFCRPSDSSHFSRKGAEKMAALIVGELKAQKCPLAAYVRDIPLSSVPEKPVSRQAQAVKGSVHLFGKDSNITMSYDGGDEGISGCFAEWMKEEKEKRLIVTVPAGPEWTKHTFSFTPKASGNLLLILMGEGKDVFVCYDDVEAEGCAVSNGDFERIGSNGVPEKWSVLNKPVVVTGEKDAHSGRTYVKCSSDNRLNYNLQAEAGRKIAISLWTRADDLK